jgi:hypothetical protein
MDPTLSRKQSLFQTIAEVYYRKGALQVQDERFMWQRCANLHEGGSRINPAYWGVLKPLMMSFLYGL